MYGTKLVEPKMSFEKAGLCQKKQALAHNAKGTVHQVQSQERIKQHEKKDDRDNVYDVKSHSSRKGNNSVLSTTDEGRRTEIEVTRQQCVNKHTDCHCHTWAGK